MPEELLSLNHITMRSYSVDVGVGVGSVVGVVGFGCGAVGFGAGPMPRQRRQASPVRPEHDLAVLTGPGVVPLHLRHASPVRPVQDGGGVQ